MKKLQCTTLIILAASLWLLFPVNGLAQEQSDEIQKLIEGLKHRDPAVRASSARDLASLGAESKEAETALILALRDEDSDVRRNAAGTLGRSGTKSKEAEIALIVALKDDDSDVRSNAASALAGFGDGSKEAETALILALRDEDSDVRRSAVGALSEVLGRSGTESKEAETALIVALKDDDSVVRSDAAWALGQIAAESKESASALIVALKDEGINVRRSAASALGRSGTESKEAVFVLIVALKDEDFAVRSDAANALVIISQNSFDSRRTDMLPQLKEVYAILQNDPDPGIKAQAVEIKRTIDFLESFWWVGLREKIGQWLVDNSYITGIVVAYLLILICWLLMFWLRPLWLLSISGFLYRYEPKIKTQNMEINLPLRHLLLVSLFHFRERVLDRWVLKYLKTARENFESKLTVRQRNTYVQSPTELNEKMYESISPSHLQPIFNKPKITLLIFGEGGAGKTSLTCQIASWAMADAPEKRLCKGHRMLPVLIEGNIEAGEKNALTENISGHLKELIGEPEPVSEELLLHLLRKRRVLVIVDSLSELDDATRNLINPLRKDFPVAALIVTSRLHNELKDANRATIKPLRLQSDRLSKFMNDYLVNKKKRDLFTDEDYFESCRRLSQIVGKREITALIAKLYAEQMIASREQSADFNLPRNLPDLMLGFIRIINERVLAQGKETRDVQRAAKILAWECLKQTCRPSKAKLDDVLKVLKKEKDGEALLSYLENRLHLIQTVGVGRDGICFSLDPLAEYLACLHLVEQCGRQERKWQEIFDIIKEQGAPEKIKGFLLALRDCCEHDREEHEVPEWVSEKLSSILAPSSESVSDKQPEFV